MSGSRSLLSTAVCCATAVLGGILASAPLAAADSIDEMVQNTGALESPFWRHMYEDGLGYLDAQRVSNDSKIVCANRKAGVPAFQIAPLLESRGYSNQEARGLILAEVSASVSAHSIC